MADETKQVKIRTVQQVEVSKLKLNPKNPRKNDAAVDTVAKSIEKFGFNTPLFCDSTYTVYCGNTRLKAAQKLNLKSVPCIVADDLTPEQIREYALIDNKSAELAEWDYELLEEELADLDMSDYDIPSWTGGGTTQPNEYPAQSLKANDIKFHTCPNCGCEFED